MSSTVQSRVNGSFPSQADEALRRVQQPRTWTFTNRDTGQLMTVTCMAGCVVDHSDNIATPTFAGDVWCQTPRENVTLPLNAGGHPEEFRVLGSEIRVMPFSETIAERLPHVTLEMIDDHYIEGLDPDGLATVIRTLAERLDTLKDRHAELVQVRAEYVRRQA